ncbi:LOW QUALITY PROTEIN: RNA polymerase-associated protein RTF1 homolog [Etheostoma spectabile]|uniref:LOW QUALITY PROTEIN: RNA polymerase-associated protein RTF1 homolog n=1 Tax=Etheostoma spectabile TaxID=54343 RepID=UPI0013AECF01|nr:LOW QUALITY PROTEIN: RNA polymerase-associated protein RTF1 homolog [Etheostoma spectabile]
MVTGLARMLSTAFVCLTAEPTSSIAASASLKHLDDTEVASRLAVQLIMVNVKKRKGRVVIDSDSEDSASDDNLDQELLSLAKRKRVDSGDQEEPVSKPAASTDSETSDSDDEWTVGGTKGKKKVKQGKGSEKKNATKKKVHKTTASGSSDGDSSAESSAPEEGEVSDSESNSSSSSSDSDSSEDEVFRDGYDDDLMGDAEDRARLEQMTEKEREQELFNRIEKREVLKRRFEIKKKLKTAKKKEKEEKKKKQEEEQEKRKLSQVQDTQVVMSHNKERRSKRDEKLDKKSQAMEELKAEREKKKNKTAELLAKRQPLKTSEVYSDDEEEEEEDDDKSSVKSDRSSRSSSYDDDEEKKKLPPKSQPVSLPSKLNRGPLPQTKAGTGVSTALFWAKPGTGFFDIVFDLSSSYINQRNRSWNIVESEKALVAEGQNAKNQQMDPFTRRQCKPTMVSNARDPSVHAAILAHLNQKYGSGSAQDPQGADKDKLGLPNSKDKDGPKPNTDLSEDLFKVHDFDVKIDLQVPNAEAKSLSVSSNALPVKDGAPRRSLNLEDYKKRRGLI